MSEYNIDSLVRDPDFQRRPFNERRAILTQADPQGFGGLDTQGQTNMLVDMKRQNWWKPGQVQQPSARPAQRTATTPTPADDVGAWGREHPNLYALKEVGKDFVNAFNPNTPTAPAQSLGDWATRVVPESVTKLPGRLIKGAYETVKGQTDPLVQGLASIGGNQPVAPISGQMLTNAANSVKGIGAATLQGVGFGMDENNNVNWSLDNAKNAWATDPAGSALGLAILAPGVKSAGQDIGQASKAAIKAPTDLTAGFLGTTTGTGKNYIKQAVRAGYENSPEFTKYMRGGEEGGAEIVQAAKSAVQQLKDQRGDQYRAQLDQIAQNTEPITDAPAVLQQKLNGNLNRFGVKMVEVDDGVGGITYKPDFSRSTLNRKAQGDVAEIIDTINSWGTKEGDLTPLGLDTLKRQLDDFYSESKNSRALVSNLRNEVKSLIVNRVPEYADMTKGYEEASGLINELERTLSLGKKPMIDTTLRKLTQSMRDNFQFRKELLDTLSDMTGQNLQDMIAGYNMSSWAPQGGFGKLTSIGIVGGTAAHVLTPAYLSALAVSSPRLVGESLRALGITGRALSTVMKELPKIKGMVKDQRGMIGDIGDAELLVNPTRNELNKALHDSPHKELRIVKDPATGDVYAADAGSTYHKYMVQKAGLDWSKIENNPNYMFTVDRNSISKAIKPH